MVTKRDGRVVPFDADKIKLAIGLSIKEDDVANTTIDEIINVIYYEVITILSNMNDVCDVINVEDIQDIIVASMKNLGYIKSARNFTTYRNKRNKVRERKTTLMKQISEMANASAAESDGKRENANIDGDTAMGTMLKFGTTTSKEYYLREVIPEDAANLHRSGYIHIHDMDFYTLTTTCLQAPLGKLLANGFSTGHGHLRTPNGINTAAALTCIVIQSNQNDQHGGQSIPKFDYDLAPYVARSFITNICEYLDDNEISEGTIKNIKEQLEILHEKSSSLMSENTLDIIKDIIEENILNNSTLASRCIKKAIKRTDRDTYQAMEALIHNLNTMNCMHKTQLICAYKPIANKKEFHNLSKPEKQGLKNLLLTLYNDKFLTLLDIQEQLGINKKLLTYIFDYFEIKRRTKKENSEAVANRLLRTIGVSNAMKLPENVEKVKQTQFANNNGMYAFNTDKQKQTCLERYGSINPMTGSAAAEIKEKIRNTSLERYGVPCSLQNKDVQKKAQQTCLKKYGDIYVMGKNSSIRNNLEPFGLATPEGQQKAKDAQREKYNGHWGFGDAATSEKIKATCKERYGYENPALPCMHGKAKSEELVVNFLRKEFPDIEILTNKRSLIPSNKRLEVDIYIPAYKFAIEINGTYSHDKDKYLDDVLNGTCYTKEMKKCELLHKEGIKLIHIWEDDLYANESLKLNRIMYKLLKWICIDYKEEEE